MPASWPGSAVAVLGPPELLTGASPAAPRQGHPVQRALLGWAASSPCLNEQAGVDSRGNGYKTPCGWAGFTELRVMDAQLRSEKASLLRACNGNVLEVRKKFMLWDNAVQRWMLLLSVFVTHRCYLGLIESLKPSSFACYFLKAGLWMNHRSLMLWWD